MYECLNHKELLYMLRQQPKNSFNEYYQFLHSLYIRASIFTPFTEKHIKINKRIIFAYKHLKVIVNTSQNNV